MTEETSLEVTRQNAVAQRPSFFAMTPKQQVATATEMADALTDIIEKQKLYTLIQGKKYVKVEGWQTLGTFLGVLPKERTVVRLSDGSYEAFVDLIKFNDGVVVGSGSALCSVNEKRWANADDYARRSMAITRATGKAFRSGFSWIVTLAGYEATPEEEMPNSQASGQSLGAKSSGITQEIYTGTTEQQTKIASHLKKEGLDSAIGLAVDTRLQGKPFTTLNVGAAIRAAQEDIKVLSKN